MEDIYELSGNGPLNATNGYEGPSINCPRCGDFMNLSLILSGTDCIRCGLEMAIHIEVVSNENGEYDLKW